MRLRGTRERAGILLMVTTAPERMRLVAEIKSTEWIGRPADNHQLFMHHLRQLYGDLDIPTHRMEVGGDSVTATLLCPHRPDEETVEQPEALTLPRGVMAVVYDDIVWATST